MNGLIDDLKETGRVSYSDDEKYHFCSSHKKDIIEMGFIYKEISIQLISNYLIVEQKMIIIKDPLIRRKFKKLPRDLKRQIFNRRLQTLIQLCKFKGVLNKMHENNNEIYLHITPIPKRNKQILNEMYSFSKFLQFNTCLDINNNCIVISFNDKF